LWTSAKIDKTDEIKNELELESRPELIEANTKKKFADALVVSRGKNSDKTIDTHRARVAIHT
jgi:hypothetical protein